MSTKTNVKTNDTHELRNADLSWEDLSELDPKTSLFDPENAQNSQNSARPAETFA